MIDTYDKDVNRKVVGKLKRCTGKTLEYLGMTISYEVKGEVTFKMEDCTQKMIKAFEDDSGIDVGVKKTQQLNIF